MSLTGTPILVYDPVILKRTPFLVYCPIFKHIQLTVCGPVTKIHPLPVCVPSILKGTPLPLCDPATKIDSLSVCGPIKLKWMSPPEYSCHNKGHSLFSQPQPYHSHASSVVNYTLYIH